MDYGSERKEMTGKSALAVLLFGAATLLSTNAFAGTNLLFILDSSMSSPLCLGH
jgi:hypothetical protein